LKVFGKNQIQSFILKYLQE